MDKIVCDLFGTFWTMLLTFASILLVTFASNATTTR